MKLAAVVAPTLAAVAALALAAAASAQTPADSAAIRAAALDYIEGWYAGDEERMARAVHPELVKRIVETVGGRDFVDTMGAGKLVAGTEADYGRQVPEADRRTDVTILDVFGDAASVKVDAGPWVDYMHLARIDGEWRIVNVLWERSPER